MPFSVTSKYVFQWFVYEVDNICILNLQVWRRRKRDLVLQKAVIINFLL